jgi:hypothetical protein
MPEQLHGSVSDCIQSQYIVMKASTKTQTLDQKTIVTLLDVAGSCITDIAFNHLYDRAIAVHEKTSRGLAECYRQTLSEYINESDSPRFCSVLLNSIHHYTRMSTIYNDISYPNCINLYASLFVPQMYIGSLTSEQKLNILSMIFSRSVHEFASAIIQRYIRCIIDDHNDPSNVEELQDCILKILLHERDVSYERFIQSQKSSPSTKPVAQTATVVKLTSAFKKSINERSILKKKNAALARKHLALAKQFEEVKSMLLSQLSTHKEQHKIISELKKCLQQPNGLSIASKPEEAVDEDDSGLFSVQYV